MNYQPTREQSKNAELKCIYMIKFKYGNNH